MSKVRIMVRGEDGMEFCFKNNIPEHSINDSFEECNESYPYAIDIWTEQENSHHFITDEEWETEEW